MRKGTENASAELARWLVQTTATEDAGCLSYAIYQHRTDPRIFLLQEQWSDQASLDRHRKRALPRAIPDLVDQNDVVIFDDSEFEPIAPPFRAAP